MPLVSGSFGELGPRPADAAQSVGVAGGDRREAEALRELDCTNGVGTAERRARDLDRIELVEGQTGGIGIAEGIPPRLWATSMTSVGAIPRSRRAASSIPMTTT